MPSDMTNEPQKLSNVPKFIHRSSTLLLVLYLPSRGLLELHYMGTRKRVHAVNIFTRSKFVISSRF